MAVTVPPSGSGFCPAASPVPRSAPQPTAQVHTVGGWQGVGYLSPPIQESKADFTQMFPIPRTPPAGQAHLSGNKAGSPVISAHLLINLEKEKSFPYVPFPFWNV